MAGRTSVSCKSQHIVVPAKTSRQWLIKVGPAGKNRAHLLGLDFEDEQPELGSECEMICRPMLPDQHVAMSKAMLPHDQRHNAAQQRESGDGR
jgi:hypothetical protein